MTIDMSAFELYNPHGNHKVSSERKKTLSISPSGKLSLYQPIPEEYLTTEHLKLYYSKESQTIAIQAVKDSDETTINIQSTGNSHFISIGRFLKRFEIKITERKQLPYEFDEENKILTFKIA